MTPTAVFSRIKERVTCALNSLRCRWHTVKTFAYMRKNGIVYLYDTTAVPQTPERLMYNVRIKCWRRSCGDVYIVNQVWTRKQVLQHQEALLLRNPWRVW